jgi:hypothetical protein
MSVAIKNIIDKLSSYNLFNYLFPGFLFVILLKATTRYFDCLELDFSTVVVIYFLGLVISRVGSLLIEELLMRGSIITKIDTKTLFEKYQNNIKLEIIVEAMNMYRTLAAMSIILSLLTILDMIICRSFTINGIIYSLLELLVFILFTFAFKKQRGKVMECIF